MRLSFKVYFSLLIGALIIPSKSFLGQPTDISSYNSSAGQTKAELVGAAFSAYVSGDILQAQIYLQRARQLDRSDVTIQRLLENLAPTPAPNPIPTPTPATSPAVVNPVGTSAQPDLYQPQPLSANERARRIALSNGMSPALVDEASKLEPYTPRTVSPPPISTPFSQPSIPPVTEPASSRYVPEVVPSEPAYPSPTEPLTLSPLTDFEQPELNVPGIPPPPPVPTPTTSSGGPKLNLIPNNSTIPTPYDAASDPVSPILPELPEIISAPEPILYPPPSIPTPEPESSPPPTPAPAPFYHNPPELPPLNTPELPAPPSVIEESVTEPLQLPPPSKVFTTSSASQERVEELIMEIGLMDAQLLDAQQGGDAEKEQELTAKVGALRDELKSLEDELLSRNSAGVSHPDISMVEPEDDPLKIKVGETIELMILEDESFNGMYEVRLGGYILIPKVGRAPVEGMTVQEAEQSIFKLIHETMIKNPSVIVERPNAGDIEESGGIIYLTGEFKRPGPFTIIRGRTPSVTSVFIHAGGETPKADLTKVRVMRLVNGKNQVEVIDLDEIINGNLGRDMILRDGDIVQIPARQNIANKEDGGSSPALEHLRQKLDDPVKPTTGRDNGVFVTGRVKSSGFLEMENGVNLTAYAAILSRGGFSPFANPSKVYVLRETGGGQKVHIPVDIKMVRLGLEPDIELKPRDIIHVPEKFFSF